MAASWLWILVRTDFVLAMLLLVITPLGLLVASIRDEKFLSAMLVYWRVSSLLMIAVYLMAAELTVGFLAGVSARILIPLALYFGDALGEVKTDRKLFLLWRRVATGYCTIGVFLTLPLLVCLFEGTISESSRVWLEPPKEFFKVFHSTSNAAEFGNAALTVWWIYVGYTVISLLVVLRRVMFKQ